MPPASEQAFLLKPGDFFANRYRVCGQLGSGAMGWVVKAEDSFLENQEVALKILFPHLFRSESAFTRFRQETSVAMRMSHPHVVQTYNMGVADQLAYIAMENVDGRNLKEEILEAGPPHEKLLGKWLCEIAQGLHYAHLWGIIHRDLKPDNVLLAADGRLKIADFGVAQLLREESAHDAPGCMVGTPYYMSPEQIRGEVLDERSDLYSFGILAYELAMGRLPFQHRSLYGLAQLHLEEPLPELPPEQPQWVNSLVQRCCEKDRQLRFSTAADICSYIEQNCGVVSKVWRIETISERWNAGEAKARGAYKFSKWFSRNWPLLLFVALAGFFPVSTYLNGSMKRYGDRMVLALERATEMRHPWLRLLVNADAELGDPERSFFVPARSRVELVPMLQAGQDPNYYSAKRRQYAVHFWASQVVGEKLNKELAALLAAGARLDVFDGHGHAPLDLAIQLGRPQLIISLIEYGAPVNLLAKDGKTPLIRAVAAGSLRIASLLLHAGADPNIAGSNGVFPLQIAVLDANPKLVKLLLKYGARTDVRDGSGRDLFDLLESHGDKAYDKEQLLIDKLLREAR